MKKFLIPFLFLILTACSNETEPADQITIDHGRELTVLKDEQDILTVQRILEAIEWENQAISWAEPHSHSILIQKKGHTTTYNIWSQNGRLEISDETSTLYHRTTEKQSELLQQYLD
ncbi:hypothetical protein [Jeotgalibacillus sp. R-1-5s-1]|uniref:hypothetical protein n=1 Tax=Jeotgalibacillus sp. R-1-5s-1 TaxID=2555897 RepID=UPI00106D1E44|nr:hypothetical protein [Jeotgalibacillus sp. R-1-5s-1]TFD99660.1 hypothetical protein E2491_07120 [Jeotgalibacillus sp. R-1-5s-1]